MSEMRVVGIRVEQPQNQPVLLLRESDGDRYLPIWIGQTEAAAIALEQQGVQPARPLTHDLVKNLISALGHELKEVRIVDLQEGTFYADLVFDQDIRVSARPSDSVAIALRAGVPIYAEEPVLAEAGLVRDVKQGRERVWEVDAAPLGAVTAWITALQSTPRDEAAGVEAAPTAPEPAPPATTTPDARTVSRIARLMPGA